MPTTNESIGLTCSNCGHQAEKPLGWLRLNNQFPCPGCGDTVEFDGKAILDEVERVIEQAKARLGRTVERINRSLKSGK